MNNFTIWNGFKFGLGIGIAIVVIKLTTFILSGMLANHGIFMPL